MELLESLNKKFTERYGKQLAELNKNIYPAAKLDDGNYEAPTITIGGGGGTVVADLNTKLNPPAPVTVEMKKTKSFDIVYRLAIPRSEVEIAEKNPFYFNYLFDKVLEKAINNYRSTVGGPDAVRFGSHYLKTELLNVNDGSDFVELKLNGSWAGDNLG